MVGSTEATHDFLANRPGRAKAGSSGEVTPAFTAKVVDDEGREVPNGEVGNLYVAGDATAPYYWNKHEQTQRTMLGEWLRTGDTYYRDDDGYFWYCGRSDDMLKVGGLWVSPIEVENALMEHPAVLEAAVTGEADKDGLIKPKAWVILKSEHNGAGGLAQELQDFVKDSLEPVQVPALGGSSWTTCPRPSPEKSSGSGSGKAARSRAGPAPADGRIRECRTVDRSGVSWTTW